MNRELVVDDFCQLVRERANRDAAAMLDAVAVRGASRELVDQLRADLEALVALDSEWEELAAVLREIYDGPDGVGAWLRSVATATRRGRARGTGEDLHDQARRALGACLGRFEVFP